MRAERLDQLEENIRRIPGVEAATVAGADTPSEIHIVASHTRSPKQLVRDIQSLASAGFGFSIDHRIVSIVRLEETASPESQPGATVDVRRPAPAVQPRPSEPTAPPAESISRSDSTDGGAQAATGPGPQAAADAGPEPQPKVIHVDDDEITPDLLQEPEISGPAGSTRPILDQMIFGLKDGVIWAKVALKWPDGTVTEGVSAAGEAREVRARAAGAAFLKALQPYLSSRGARLEIEQLLLHKSGARELVLVRAMFSDKGALTPLAGSAIIHDDVATATVHALLHASNRKLVSLTA